MTSDHLLVPNRHLPFGMLITHLLKQLNFDLSSEQSFEPSVDINSTLLKRMRPRERPPAPQPQPFFPAVPGSSSDSSAPFDPYLALSTQLREHHQQLSAEMTEHHQQISAEMTAHYRRMEQRLDNDLSHICDSICYMHTCLGGIYNRLIGRLLFLVNVLSHFLLPALRSLPGLLLLLLLLLLLRHLLPRRTLILGDIDPF